MKKSGEEREFIREFPPLHQKKLTDCSLYPDLVALVRNGELFPAIRERVMDFYCGGHRAFRRGRDVYKSNDYFLSTSEQRKEGEKSRDLSFEKLPSRRDDFQEEITLEMILDRCRKKAEKDNPEALQLAKTFPFFSFAAVRQDKDAPILIDVEARFAPLEKGQSRINADMVDLVFLLPTTKELLFVEGKRRNDSRIRCKKGIPEVVNQVARYREQLTIRGSQILNAYSQASDAMEAVFGCTFPKPLKILKQVPILVVGDNDIGKDLQHNPNANDNWLEPELKESKDAKYRVWSKDGAILLDARSIFLDPKNKMEFLASGLTELADTIRRA